jgi:hypothetical protein
MNTNTIVSKHSICFMSIFEGGYKSCTLPRSDGVLLTEAIKAAIDNDSVSFETETMHVDIMRHGPKVLVIDCTNKNDLTKSFNLPCVGAEAIENLSKVISLGSKNFGPSSKNDKQWDFFEAKEYIAF